MRGLRRWHAEARRRPGGCAAPIGLGGSRWFGTHREQQQQPRAVHSASPQQRSAPPPSDPPARKELIERLTHDVFSRGNQVLKRAFATVDELPEGLHSFPEVCFIGRPSSGKSALIGALLRNKRLTRPGTTPGNTNCLGFFNVGDALLLVDTPGWGAWRRNRDMQFDRARALALLRQYITVRKRTNLQRVYWTFAVTPGGIRLGPREEEILEFLVHEGVPFTAVMTKIDRVDFSSSVLQREAGALFSFFGSADVPVIDVCSDPYRTGRSANIHALRCDVVHHCAKVLRDEQLTLSAMRRELSYLPPSAAEKSRAEQHYPLEAHVIPDDNRVSAAVFARDHNANKAELLTDIENGRASAALGAGDTIAVLNPDANAIAPLACEGAAAGAPDHVSSVIGAPVPKSAVSLSITAAMAKVEGSLHHYSSFIGSPYSDALAQNSFFVERHPRTVGGGVDDPNPPEDRRGGISRWEARRGAQRRKFIDGVRKPRSLYLHSDVLCPWLGQDERGSVRGVGESASPNSQLGHATGRVSGLKATGFGGKSVVGKTLRQKGRATRKVGRWST